MTTDMIRQAVATRTGAYLTIDEATAFAFATEFVDHIEGHEYNSATGIHSFWIDSATCPVEGAMVIEVRVLKNRYVSVRVKDIDGEVIDRPEC